MFDREACAIDHDLKALRCFVTLAEDLNFGRAAERLRLTQPALSSQIRVLEARLGLTLFTRSTRRVDLSEAGQALLPAVRKLLDQGRHLQRSIDALRGLPRRKLGFGAAFYTIDIPERVHLLEGFFAAHPDVALDVTPDWQRNLIEALQDDRLDAALLIGLAVPRSDLARELAADPTVEILYPDDLPRHLVRREPVALLIPVESPLAALAEIPATALAGQRVAVLGPNHGQVITAPIRRLLDAGGALPIVPPESHGIGVERFGRQFRIPAMTLGWFGGGGANDDMVRVPLCGLELHTELALVLAPGDTSADAGTLLDFARRMRLTRADLTQADLTRADLTRAP